MGREPVRRGAMRERLQRKRWLLRPEEARAKRFPKPRGASSRRDGPRAAHGKSAAPACA
jgi:hypothetical protein